MRHINDRHIARLIFLRLLNFDTVRDSISDIVFPCIFPDIIFLFSDRYYLYNTKISIIM